MTNKTQSKLIKINVGPQHPSTHGVLRLVIELDGEIIKSCEPVVGYLHRGMEKMAESRTYLQYLPTVDRVDYLSGFFNAYAFCDAVENLAQIEVSKSVKYIRVLTMEMDRLASHLLWLGTFMLDLGATTPLFYTFRDREVILSLFESLTGQRLMYNYYTFGGVRHSIPCDWLDKTAEFIKYMPSNIQDYENIITGNPIFVARTRGVGIISKKTALQYSLTGPNIRACGIDLDCRKQKPYAVYNELEFDAVTAKKGDSFDRYKVRIEEMRVCLKIITQCVDWLKSNQLEVVSNIKQPLLKVPQGEYISTVEAPRGLCNCYLLSDGTNKPYRVKWRTGSYYSVQALPKLLEKATYPDLMAIFGSLDVILPEVDR